MSRQPGLSEWIDLVSTHMPHLSVPQARVLALWSYGIALTRSCGRLTVATFLALLMGQRLATVEQRLYEWCWRFPSQSGRQTAAPGRHHVFCPLAALDCDLVDGDTPGLGPRRHDLGGAVCGADPECCLSRMRHPRGLDRLAREPAWRLAPGMVAPVAGCASCHPTGLDSAGAGGPRFVGALALWAHCASGLASAAADQQRGQVPSCWPDTVVLAPRVGPRREPVLVWPGDRLCSGLRGGSTVRWWRGGVRGTRTHGFS